jgi:hypothetical protein
LTGNTDQAAVIMHARASPPAAPSGLLAGTAGVTCHPRK